MSTRTSSAEDLRTRGQIGFCLLALFAALAASSLASAAADAGKAKTIGTDSCLVCHSDRPEMKAFPHRERTEELGGCESCHGAGSAHALSRGDPALILNPRRAEPAKADRACLLCHSDKAAPAHFTPAPGKEKCADCHTIHPPAPVAAPSPAATPGRPPFALDLGAEPPAPVAARPFPLKILPPLPELAPEAGGWRTSGEARLGIRLVNVTGNERVYDQDVNLDDGPRLFDLSFDARSLGPTERRIRFEASGICDPLETYSLALQSALDWELTADYRRLNQVYRATGDPRDTTSRREDLRLATALFPHADLRFSLGFDMNTREGRVAGSRFVPGAVAQDREPFEDRTHHIWARAEYSTGGLTLGLTQGWRFDRLEADQRTLPVVPSSLDYAERTDGDGPVTTLLAAFDASESLKLDGKFVWSDLDTRTRGTGTFTDEDVTETRESIRGSATWLRGEIGAAWLATEEFSFAARVAGTSDDSEVRSDVREARYDDPADPPDMYHDRVQNDRDQDRLRASVEGLYRPSSLVAFRLGYEWMWEDFDQRLEDGGRTEDDTEGRGFLAGIDLDPADDFSVEGLYRFVRVDDPFAPIGTADDDQARVRARYSGLPDAEFSAFLAHRLTTNRLHDTEIFSWVAGLNAGLSPATDLTVNLGFEWQSFDTQTDGVLYYDNVPVEGRAEFDGEATNWYADLNWRPIPEVALSAGASFGFARGDYDYDWYRFWLGASYDFTEWLTVGADGKVTIYDDHLVSVDDYKGWILELWFRFRF
ncbi:MAG: hypothetical protein MUE73_10100 [Planctomycetes bacterium]|nr:hypothetical protein [Planctomycetota bacterium]